MKKQLTYEVGEKPTFENEVELRQTLTFLVKAAETVKLYNKHSKALKEFMLANDKTDVVVDDYHAHISTGTARKSLNSQLIEDFLKSQNLTIEDFKTLGNPPKSLEVYRD